MEQYFATIFEDIRHERSLNLLLSLVEPSILKQVKITYHQSDNIKDTVLQNLHQQRNLKKIIALDLLEKQLSD